MTLFQRSAKPSPEFAEARVRAHIALDEWLDIAKPSYDGYMQDTYQRRDVVGLGWDFSGALIDAWNKRPRGKRKSVAREDPFVVVAKSGRKYQRADIERIIEAVEASL